MTRLLNTFCSIGPLATVLCFAIVSHPAGGADDLETLEQQAFQAAVDWVAGSVVRIETVGGLERMGKLLFGAGPTTGLVVDEQGYIISSAFNFVRRPDSILVQLPGGPRQPARLVATDHSRKLVLLKIDVEKPLPVPEMAPRSENRVGQWTIAVGRTFQGNQPNMSVGVLSAVSRIWGKAIQTDAAVSPANYGGPLLDIHGRVLGVIVPLSPKSEKEIAGVEWYDAGIGFAVPAEDIRRVLPRLKKGEDLHPGVIGISFRGGNLSTAKPVVGACRPNSPAYDAGLKTGDRIVRIDDREVAFASQVKEGISRRYAGEKVRLVVLRDEKQIEKELQLVAELPPYEHPMLGILPMRTVDEKPSDSPAGVTVRYVFADSAAAKAALKPGDLLVSFETKPVESARWLRRKIAEFQPGDEVQLELRRGRQKIQVKAPLGRLPEGLPGEELPPPRADLEPSQGERPKVGVVELKVPDLENDAWAYVPQKYDPAVPHGVVVWLHAPGEFDRQPLVQRWKPYCERHDLILLAPKSIDPARWLPNEEAVVGKLLDEIVGTYTVDRTRIVVHGHQGGGTLGYLVAFRHRGLVRAVAAVDAPMASRPPDADPLHRLAFYVTTAKKSRFARRIQRGIATLRGMKYPVAVKNIGQQARYLTADELAELVRWIDTLDRI